MRHKVERIVEDDHGKVFTVTRDIRAKGVHVVILRVPHLETDVAISPATEDLINRIRDKK